MFNSYDKFADNFKKVIQKAAWICLNEFKQVIAAEHLLKGLLAVKESRAYEILKQAGIAPKVEENLKQIGEEQHTINPAIGYNEVFNLSMDNAAVKILEQAAEVAIRYHSQCIDTEHLLCAIAELKIPFLADILKKTGIDTADFENYIKQILLQDAKKQKTPIQNQEKNQHKATKQKVETALISKTIKKPFMVSTPAIDYFTTDLTDKHFQTESHPLIGRDKEMERLIHILSRKQKNNPLLIGDTGVGKTAIVEGLAQRIYQGKVPDILANKRILNLDLNSVVAGAIYRGEFENRLKQILEEIKSQDDVILFIDEIHNLIGAGSASGSMDAANILKPYLARGEISLIGATTFVEYKSHFESDAALERRFQTIIIEEPSADDTMAILEGIRSNLESYHHVKIENCALKEAVNLSERFIPNKYFPDKAIDLIDEAAAKAKVKNSKDTYGKQIRMFKDALKQIHQEKSEAVAKEDFSAAIMLKDREEQALKTLYDLKKKQKKEQLDVVGVISKKDIIAVVVDMIKIPFLEMSHVNTNKLLNIENILKKRILGQDLVLKEIAKTLRRSEAGLADPKRPLASFIFLGPSGVGKTETAKVIAEEVFGDKNALIRINMSEFQESFNISKLIGAPAGYIGYKDGNQLADRVRARPYSVVLFDEMEKAHPDVLNLLLQVLEDGYLIDSGGKHINFKNSIIIFTSNIGLERFNKTQSLGFAARTLSQKMRIKQQFELVKANILNELYDNFRVEFLNRIDKILFFEPLSYQTIASIVEINIQKISEKLQDRDLQIALSPAAKHILAKKSFSPDDGARAVRRVVQEQVEETLVEKLLKGVIKAGDTVKIGVNGKRVVVTK